MPTHAYYCSKCLKTTEHTLPRGAKPVCGCGQPLERRLSTNANFFIHSRDTAAGTSSNARYRDWVNSPEVQEKIKRGELVREGDKNELQDYLDEMCRGAS